MKAEARPTGFDVVAMSDELLLLFKSVQARSWA